MEHPDMEGPSGRLFITGARSGIYELKRNGPRPKETGGHSHLGKDYEESRPSGKPNV
jgi:hypothetical protein